MTQEGGAGMLKEVVLPGTAALVVLGVFFYLVGERGTMLVLLALLPSLIGTLVFWNRWRKGPTR
jgi:hypothetical protein